jgi:hypothetical protein
MRGHRLELTHNLRSERHERAGPKAASECRRMGHDSMVCAAGYHTGRHSRRGSRACVLSVIRGRVNAR